MWRRIQRRASLAEWSGSTTVPSSLDCIDGYPLWAVRIRQPRQIRPVRRTLAPCHRPNPRPAAGHPRHEQRRNGFGHERYLTHPQGVELRDTDPISRFFHVNCTRFRLWIACQRDLRQTFGGPTRNPAPRRLPAVRRGIAALRAPAAIRSPPQVPATASCRCRAAAWALPALAYGAPPTGRATSRDETRRPAKASMAALWDAADKRPDRTHDRWRDLTQRM